MSKSYNTQLFFAFSLFLLIIPNVLAQSCMTGADDPAINTNSANCDGIVNLTELLDYIDLWYACSSCHPDMFEAVETWFAGQQAQPECGNGLIETGEACDDTNTAGGDGCSSDCQTESGWTCSEEPSVCIIISEETYYVGPPSSCDDTYTEEEARNPGSPWCLEGAKDYANTNPDKEITFLLLEGDYGTFNDATNVRTEWVKWKAVNKNGAVFNSINLGQWTGPYNKYLIFENLKIEPGSSSLLGVISYRANYVKLINLTIEGNGYIQGDKTVGIYLRRVNNFDIIDCYIGGSVTDFEPGFPTATGFDNGIYSQTDYDSSGIETFNIIVEGNEIVGCRHGIVAWGENWTIYDNHLHHLDSDGIWVTGLNNSLIKENYIHDLERPQDEGYHEDGIQFGLSNSAGMFGSNNVVVDGNYIYNTGVQGIFLRNTDMDYAIRNITFSNNVIYTLGSSTLRATEGVFDIAAINNTAFNYGGFEFGGDLTTSVKEISGNIFEKFSVFSGVIPEYEDYNLLNQWWTRMSQTEYDQWKGAHSVELEDDDAFREIFFNLPVFCEDIQLNTKTVNGVVLGNNGQGKTTLTHQGTIFTDLQVLPGYNYFPLHVYADGNYLHNGTDLIDEMLNQVVKRVEDHVLTLDRNITGVPGSLVNITLTYSPSTRTKIYVSDSDPYRIGHVIDYMLMEIAFEIINKDSDAEGEYIVINDSLHERARGGGNHFICNFGFSGNVKRDFRPISDSIICDQGVAWAGALECVPCSEGSTRDCETGELGVCADGQKACNSGVYSTCTRKTEPYSESSNCDDGLDNDCDGKKDCEDIEDCSTAQYCEGKVGLSIFLRFDNDNANNWFSGHDGVWNENEQYEDRAGGRAAVFNGTSQVNIGDVDLSQEFTVANWFKVNSILASPRWNTILYKNLHYWTRFDSDSDFEFAIGNGNSWISGSLRDYKGFDTGKWYHIATVYNASGMHFYVNGSYDLTFDPGEAIGGNANDFIIGARDGGEGIDGSIDEVMIYTRALNSTEIRDIYCDHGGQGALCNT